MRVELIDPMVGYEAVEPHWFALAGSVKRSSWFHLPAAFRVWHETLRRGGATQIAAVYDDHGALSGIMPFMRDRAWRGPTCMPRYDYAPSDRAFIARCRPGVLPVRQLVPAASIPATML